MRKYLIGLIKNLFNPAVSILVRIDNKSFVHKNARVFKKAKVFNSKLGAFSYVGRRTSLVYASVGKFCSIGADCRIGIGGHTSKCISTSPIFTQKRNSLGVQWSNKDIVSPYSEVMVGNDVWIGERVIIIGGHSIGDGAIIGAGAVVTKDVPPYAIVAGVPAHIIKYRFSEEIIEELLSIKWWDFDENVLKNNIGLFQVDNPSLDNIRSIKNS